MRGQNRTDASGMGAQTGRGMRAYGGTSDGAIFGNGQACRGRGKGRGRCIQQNMLMPRSPELSQKDQLAEQKERLQAQLAEITARLEQL